MYGQITTPQKDALTIIENSSNHLLKLINDILYFTNLSTDVVKLDLESIAIADLCNSSLDFVKQKAVKKQIQTTLNICPNIEFLEADPMRMRQVLISLLDNAIKFTPMGGKVSLDVKMNYQPPSQPLTFSNIIKTSDSLEQTDKSWGFVGINSWVSFAITDTGIGIAPSDRKMIFQPFIQIDSGLNRSYEGIGIGLATVKQIVELHRGYIELSSQVGQGSCFTVSIPLMNFANFDFGDR
jgi:signal transduction histidine kinase